MSANAAKGVKNYENLSPSALPGRSILYVPASDRSATVEPSRASGVSPSLPPSNTAPNLNTLNHNKSINK